MKKIIIILSLLFFASFAYAGTQNFIVYETGDTPFTGYIWQVGRVKWTQPPDGSTIKERVQAYLSTHPTVAIARYDRSDTYPDPEMVKYINGEFVPLEEGDITPKAAAEAAAAALEAAKAQAIVDNLPSWAQVETAVDNIDNLADAKAFLKKLARVVYWLAKNSAE
jgi:hypothetical protein